MISYVKFTNNPAEIVGEVNRAIAEINAALTKFNTDPLVLHGNPKNDLEAVPKQYVDALASGLNPKEAVHQTYLKKDANLMDIDAPEARKNLGLGKLSIQDSISLESQVIGTLRGKNFPKIEGDITNDGLSFTVNKVMGNPVHKIVFSGDFRDLNNRPDLGSAAFIETESILRQARSAVADSIKDQLQSMASHLWDSFQAALSAYSKNILNRQNNLDDLVDKKAARKNLELGSLAVESPEWKKYSPSVMGLSSVSYANQIGKYFQIGKLVHFNISLAITAQIDSVIKISLPVKSSVSSGETTLCLANTSFINMDHFTGKISSGSDYVQINVACPTDLPHTIILSGCYESV